VFAAAAGSGGASVVSDGPVVIRVNANGASYTDSAGNVWAADRRYAAGGFGYDTIYAIDSTSNPVSGTGDQALYQTQNLFTNWAGYKFDVPNGTYTVTLKMAEVWATGPGQRKFDVRIEGQQVLTAFDVFAACGKLTACDRTFQATVSDGQLNVQFNRNGGANWGAVAAIQVLGGSAPPPPPPPPPPTPPPPPPPPPRVI
jgi:hypothetical protein